MKEFSHWKLSQPTLSTLIINVKKRKKRKVQKKAISKYCIGLMGNFYECWFVNNTVLVLVTVSSRVATFSMECCLNDKPHTQG